MTINLQDLTSNISEIQDNDIHIENVVNNDIAIIGLSCRFGQSNNEKEYWEALKSGKDYICQLPENRRKLNEPYLQAKDQQVKTDDYYEGAFLQEVDKFDYEFFSISRLEASLMSPSQRLFLEEAWSAIEDAGYGGKKIIGSKTGVFLGHSTDFGVSYKEYVETLNPELSSFAISGNLNSIIASRISYLLDLKGPSMVVDTACSSSLSAVHLACNSIRNNECKLALVGSVKVDLLPLRSIKKNEDELGITSPDGRSRTFDDNAEGIGIGEGVGVILLKPLSKALDDGDNIYAVIKSSAVNQDGNSMNLTSPNPLAQEEVIIKAWKEAGINPETITYIEAHGTGTKLGDPIEISGIEKAFRRYTKKKQFCAIGSVKTNLGHLDNAAGMASLIKVILSLKYKQIPKSIHFNFPNKEINFEESPIYVNDIHREWENDKFPRRCGISGFGLSGTNCHIVLQEPPNKKVINDYKLTETTKVFTLSAKNREGLLELIWRYQFFLENNKDIDLNNLCFTTNCGRGQYNSRLTIIFKDIQDLKQKLESASIINPELLNCNGIFYGMHKLVSEKQLFRSKGEIVYSEKLQMGEQANLKITENMKMYDVLNYGVLSEICKMHVAGADIEWELLYKNGYYNKVSLPTYPFSRRLCWIEKSNKINTTKKSIEHPLFERCLADSFDSIIYLSSFDIDNYWVLNEHIVAKTCLAPGTTYIEMIVELMKKHYPGKIIQFKDIIFLTPLTVVKNEKKEVHTIIKSNGKNLEFIIASKYSLTNKWCKHAEGKIYFPSNVSKEHFEVDQIMANCTGRELQNYEYKPDAAINLGPRWNCIKDIHCGNNEIMTLLTLDEKFISDLDQYNLHPALMDEAINIALRSIGEGLYLPFSYKSMIVFDCLPGKIYSYIRKKSNDRLNKEIGTFDVTLMDESGNEIIRIEDYNIKKVNENKTNFVEQLEEVDYSKINWIPKPYNMQYKCNKNKNILILKGQARISEEITNLILEKYENPIIAELGSGYKKISSNRYVIGSEKEDFEKLFEDIKEREINQVVYLQALASEENVNSIEDLEMRLKRGVYGLFNFTKAVTKIRVDSTIDILLISQYAYEISKNERIINPHNASFFGLGKVINQEFTKLKCRCIDLDDFTKIDIIGQEVESDNIDYVVSYRNGKKYVQELDKLDIGSIEDNKIEIRDNGTYIITGGTGGIGLKVAKFLASKGKVNIGLINRSPFPKMDMWNEILHSSNDTRLCKKILDLKQILENGSNIKFYTSDVSDINGIKKVLEDFRNVYGRINGVFHGAGVAGDGFIIRKDEKNFSEVIDPKIKGTWILNELTTSDDLDFFVMFSSISSFLAEAGQGDYTAANCYLDSFASYKNKHGRGAITISWPAWEEVGMALEHGVDMEKEFFKPIKSKEAINVLELVLRKKINNIIVGKLNYKMFADNELYMSQLADRVKINIEDSIALSNEIDSNDKIKVNFADIILTGKQNYNEYTELEKMIASILGSVLGQREMNIFDGFVDLGGNSILAVKIEMEMENHSIPITIQDLYEFKTIKDLAEFVSRDRGDNHSTEVLNFKGNHKETRLELEGVNKEQYRFDNNEVILNNINPFSDILYKSCFYNSLFPIVRYFNKSLLNFYANDLFIYNFDTDEGALENGIIELTIKSAKNLLKSNSINVYTQCHTSDKQQEFIPTDIEIKYIDDSCNHIGISKCNNSKKVENIISDITSALTKGNPVIIWVDCYYESMRKDTYKKMHWLHTLTFYGFDSEREVLYIIEHSNRDNLIYDKKTINYQEVVDAYESFVVNYLPYVDMPSYYEFSLNKDWEDSKVVNLDPLNSFKANLLQNRNKILDGLPSLQQILNFIERVTLNESDLQNKVNILVDMISNIINAKKVEKYNLIELMGSEFKGLNNIIKVIDLWSHARQVLVKYTYSLAYNRDKMLKICEEINQIYDIELTYYNELFSAIEN